MAALLVLASMLVAACARDNKGLLSGEKQGAADARIAFSDGSTLPGQYIVVLRKESVELHGGGETGVAATIEELLSLHHIPDSAVLQTYSRAVQGAALRLSKRQLQGLRTDRRIDWIEEDQLVFLNIGALAPAKNTVRQQDALDSGSQIVKASGAPLRQWAHQVWIVDSGIDAGDQSLNIRPAHAANFTSDATLADEVGHGTYIARLIAAKPMGSEAGGVAPGAPVVPIKVLDNAGGGCYSGVMAGLDHVARFADMDDVVQISLSGPPSNALDQAVRELAAQGCRVVLAAAGGDQRSPARVNHERVVTVAADDLKTASDPVEGSIDQVASGYRREIPFPGNRYALVSGHSVAAAAITGRWLLAGTQIN